MRPTKKVFLVLKKKSPKPHHVEAVRSFSSFFNFFIYVEQYKAEAPYREDSKLSLKRVKREQTDRGRGRKP
jgi:hypothetical protein